MTLNSIVKKLQAAMNAKGENLLVDGEIGPATYAALGKFDFNIEAVLLQEELNPSDEGKKSPPWYLFALKFKGKKETDPEFSAYMVPKWKLFGLNLGTIAQNWAAWCGLAMAVCLTGAGVDYAKNGSLAKNWSTYGVAIDWKKEGIPQGAIVQINHTGDCNASSGNHVAQANGDCSPEDLLRKGAEIDLYGGNQGNTWKVSTFPAEDICAVRWPKDVKDYPKPAPITKSANCTSNTKAGDSTR